MKNVYITNWREALSKWNKYLFLLAFILLILVGSGTEVFAQTGTITGTSSCEGNAVYMGINNTIDNLYYYLIRIDEDNNNNYAGVQIGISGVPSGVPFGDKYLVGKYVVYEYNNYFGLAPSPANVNEIITSGTLQGGEVYIYANPVPTIEGETNPCFKSTETYTTQTETEISDYVWTVTNGTITSGGGSTDNTVTIEWDGILGDASSVVVSYTESHVDGNACDGTSETFGVDVKYPVYNGTNAYSTLQAAIDAASAGDEIDMVCNHTEDIVTINKAVTIDGNENTLTSTSTTYGIEVNSSDVAIQNITIDDSETYGIHAFESNNLSVNNTTISNCGEISSGTPFASGFDIHCSDNVTLTDITATGNEGNGVNITDCNGVTINGISTSGNSYGTFSAGIGIFSSGQYCTTPGSSNITITGTVDMDEPVGVYEEATVGTISNVTLPSAFTHYCGIYPSNKYYFTNLDDALVAADATLLQYPTTQPAVYVKEVDGTNLYVAPKTLATVDMSINAAIAAANAGDVININAGTYFEPGQIAINKNLTITGAGKTTTIIKPDHATSGGSYAPENGWFYVDQNVEFSLFDVTLDGRDLSDNYQTIKMAIQSRGELTVERCIIQHIKSHIYLGWGIALLDGYNNFINDVDMNNIYRIGIHIRGNIVATNPYAVITNFTYEGKGTGDFLDYGIEFGGGGQGTVGESGVAGSGATITNCKGVASSDGSTSAGILITDYYGTNTSAEVYGSVLSENYSGITIGYSDTDESVLVAHENQIYDNTDYGIYAKEITNVDAENNWWGAADGPVHNPYNTCGSGDVISGPVDFVPWCTDASCGGSSSGDALAVSNTEQGTFYCTIQDAIDDASTSVKEHIVVTDGNYTENLIIDRALYLNSASGATTTTITGSGGTAISVQADDVEIEGFTITNPSGNYAILSHDNNDLKISNNTISDIGNNALAGNTHAIYVKPSNNAIANITIEDNEFLGIHGGENDPATSNGSASAIFIGDSNSNYDVTGLVVQRNTISNVNASIIPWASGNMGGKGAYGVLIGVGASGTGQVVDPLIANNVISYLEGNWAHAIGLEGDTPGASVVNNTISDLVDYKTPSDAVAVLIEDNASAGSVNINNNSFTNLNVGVWNTEATVVDATCNWWDSADPSTIEALTQGDVQFLPFSTALSPMDCDGVGPVVNLTKILSYMTIQAAIDEASENDVIDVSAGIYIEQLHVTQNLTIQGAGDATIVKSPATLPLSFTTSNANKPVVFVDGATNFIIKDLLVDGDSQGNANYRFMGIAYWNAGGAINNVEVINVMDNPFSGAQHGNAIYAYNNTAGSFTLSLDGIQVSDFQKNAISMNGNGNLTASVNNATVTGAGPTAVTAQNGIQFWGASGTITNSEVTGINYTESGWTASAVLIYGPANVITDNVIVENSQSNFYYFNAGGSILNSSITNPKGDGIVFYNTSGTNNLLVDNVTATGDMIADVSGIAQYASAPGANSLTVTNSEFTNWDYALYSDGDVTATVTANNLGGNTYGFYTTASTTQNAENNWWGDASGPQNDPNNLCGTGSEVVGDVDYAPWYFQSGMTTTNSQPLVAIDPVDDISAITNTPVVISASATYPEMTPNTIDPSIVTDALVSTTTAFPAGCKIIRVSYYEDDMPAPIAVPADFTPTDTSFYMSDILPQTLSLQNRIGKTVTCEFTVTGAEAEVVVPLEVQFVSYTSKTACISNLGTAAAFSLSYTNATVSAIDDITACYQEDIVIDYKMSYPLVENVGGTKVKNDSKYTFWEDAAMTTTPAYLPENTVIEVVTPVGNIQSSTLNVEAHTIYGSAVVAEQSDPRTNEFGYLLPSIEREASTGLGDPWLVTIKNSAVGTVYVKIENIALLNDDNSGYPYPEYVYNEQDFAVTVNPLPTLGNVTTTVVCENSPATIHLTGLEASTAGNVTYEHPLLSGEQVASGTSNPDGTFDFETPALPFIANGTVATITSVTNSETGCSQTFDTPVTLLVNPNPTLDEVTAEPVCEGNSTNVVLNDLLINEHGTAYYTLGDDPTILEQSGDVDGTGVFSFSTPPLTVNENGLVVKVVKLKVTSTGCETEFEDKEVALTVHPLPTATIAANQTQSVCSGIAANIDVELSGTAPWSITYTDGTTPVTVESITSSPYSLSVNPTSNTTYTVTSVTDAHCSNTATASAKIYVGPITTIGTIENACPGSTITVPVTVESFDEVGSISLSIKYDPADLEFQSGAINSTIEISNLVIIDKTSVEPPFTPEPGIIKIRGFINQNEFAQSLLDGDELCTITFTYVGDVLGDGTNIEFIDTPDPAFCEYGFGDTPDFTPFCDEPTVTYYVNGKVTPDAIEPVAACQDVTVELDANGNGSTTAAAVDNGSSDYCGIKSLVLSQTDFTCSNIGPNTVTLTVTDNSGNTSTCQAEVIVEDVTPPTATCQDIEVELDASGEATITAEQIDNGSVDECSNVSLSVLPMNFTCVDLGAKTVELTVTDESGNSSTCNATVTVTDIISPVITCPANIEQVNNIGSCNATVTITNATATDNCEIASVEGVRDDGLNLSATYPNGETIITWTAIDQSGNSVSCNQVITVTDGEDPAIICPDNVTVEVNASSNPSETGFATATDNCSTAPEITFSDVWAAGSCIGTGTITRTWTATDEASNEATCIQTITVNDTETPAITCPDDILSANDEGECGAIISFDDPVSYDQGYVETFDNTNYVSGDRIGWNSYNSSIVSVLSGTNSVNAASGAGYGLIQSAGVSSTGAFGRLGSYCSDFGNGYRVRQSIYMDLNDPAVIEDTYGWDLSAASSNQDGEFLRDFIFHTASDASGNILVAGSNNTNFTRRNDLTTINPYTITSSGWYTFEFVFREEAGVLAVDLNLLNAAGTVLWTVTRSTPADEISTVVGGNRYLWFTFLAVDNLAIDNTSIERLTTVSSDYASGDEFPVGITSVTYTSTDDCGNPQTCSFDVTVNDTEKPVITLLDDATVYICQNEEYTDEGATAEDNCDGTITGSIVTVNSVDNTTDGTYTVTYNVTDVATNAAVEKIRTVIVRPLPEVDEVSLQTSTDESSWTAITGDLDAGYEMCIDPVIDYHYYDIDALISTVTLLSGGVFEQNAFYLDKSSVPDDFYTYWADKGVVNGASDWRGVMWDIINGDEPMFYISYDGTDYELIDGLQYQIGQDVQTLRISGDYPAGDYVFTGTVTDVNGCVSLPFDVGLKLNSAPVIECPVDITVNNDTGECGASVTFGATATGVPTPDIVYTLVDNTVIESGYSFPVGTTTVTATASNDCKAVSCSFDVTVNDTEKPVITLLGDATVYICQNEEYTDDGATAEDNCDGTITGSIVTVNPVATDTPDTYTVTYNVTDVATNAAVEVTRTVIVRPLPEVNAVSLQTSTDESIWAVISGDLDAGYEMCIDPVVDYHYYDIDALTSTEALLSGAFEQNAFTLDVNSVPGDFYTYWNNKGVNASATGWQAVMWDIINGGAPMFYISYDGMDYQLIDGLQYQLGQGSQTLRISGDYPAGDYVFTGTVTDVNDCVSLPFDVGLKLNSAPVIECPSDIEVSNDEGVCGAEVEFEATATGVPTPSIVYTIVDPEDEGEVLEIESGYLFPVGTTTVTATASNECKTVSCSFDVTVNDTEEPTITCPTIEAPYYANNGCTWTGEGLEPTIDDNCGTPTLEYSVDGGATFEAGVANDYDFPIGTTTITYKVTDASGNIADCEFDIVVEGATLTGTVNYNNAVNTPMSKTTVILTGNQTYTTTTDMDGDYSFDGICPGDYEVTFSHNKLVGGINATDAAQLNAWQLLEEKYSIEMVRFLAGDVSGHEQDLNTGDEIVNIRANDASKILDYFVYGSGFDKPWEYWQAGETVNSNPQDYEVLTITVESPSETPAATQNFLAMVSGDFNQSRIPDITKSLLVNGNVNLLQGKQLSVTAGNTIDIPIKAESAMQVGAISLIMNYPGDRLQVEGIFLQDNPDVPVKFNANNGELRIGWQSEYPVSLAKDETMLTLRLSVLSGAWSEEATYFTMVNDPTVELADGNYEVIKNATLVMDGLLADKSITVGIDNPAHLAEMEFNCYPNPFNEKATIKYTIPEDGNVNIEVIGIQGNRISVLANHQQAAGEYLMDLDGANLVSGVYQVTLRFKNQMGNEQLRTIRMIKR